MKRASIFTSLLLSIFLTVAPQYSAAGPRSGGSDGAGGGSGVACFATNAQADEARLSRSQGQPLPRRLIPRITSLTLLDLWEEPGAEFNLGFYPNETPDSIVRRRLIDGIGGAFPREFRERVESLLGRIRFEVPAAGGNWPIDDTGPIKGASLESGLCALVQVAVRYAHRDAEGVRAYVTVDSDLLNVLGKKNGRMNRRDQQLNQAALYMHETVYLLGFGLNHPNSAASRSATILLLSTSLDRVIEDLVRNIFVPVAPVRVRTAAQIQFVASLGFGSYLYMERDDLSPLAIAIRDGFLSFIEKRGRLSGFEVGNSVQLGSSRYGQVSHELETEREFMRDLTEPEAFVHLAFNAYLSGRIHSFYSVVGPVPDPVGMRRICEEARNHPFNFSYHFSDPFFEKAAKYKATSFCSRFSY